MLTIKLKTITKITLGCTKYMVLQLIPKTIYLQNNGIAMSVLMFGDVPTQQQRRYNASVDKKLIFVRRVPGDKKAAVRQNLV